MSQVGVNRGRVVRCSRGVGSLVPLVFAGLLLAACGSSPSAADQVCSDRTQLNGAVSSVTSALRSGNLSKAKDDVPAVRDAFDNLKDSVSQLAGEQRQALQPQIDNLKNTVSSLKDADSISSLASGLSSAASQIQSISQHIGDSLNCS